MKKRFASILLTLCMVLSMLILLPATAEVWSYAYILSLPTKTTYLVGDGFDTDTTGLNAELNDNGQKTKTMFHAADGF